MQKVGFTELVGVYPSRIVGGHGCRPCGTPSTIERKIMDTIDIKMMHTNEIKELQKKVNRELRFRESIGKVIDPPVENNSRMKIASIIDKEIKSAFTLKESLEEELTRQEMMSDRIPIREDLKEVKQKISELKTKMRETAPDMADYVDQSHQDFYPDELHGPGPDEEK